MIIAGVDEVGRGVREDDTRNDEEAQGGVLVCCRQGRSRSVVVVCAFLMFRRGMTFQNALALIREKRPVASPNMGFVLLLKKLEQEKAVLFLSKVGIEIAWRWTRCCGVRVDLRVCSVVKKV